MRISSLILLLLSSAAGLARADCIEVNDHSQSNLTSVGNSFTVQCPDGRTAQSGTCDGASNSSIASAATVDGTGWTCSIAKGNGRPEEIRARVACCSKSPASVSSSGGDINPINYPPPPNEPDPGPAAATPSSGGDRPNSVGIEPQKPVPPVTAQTPPTSTFDNVHPDPERAQLSGAVVSHEEVAAELLRDQGKISALTDTNAKDQAGHVERAAQQVFFGGVENVAIGVAQLSVSEQLKAQEGDTETVQTSRTDALGKIAVGAQAIEKAKVTSAQADVIKKNEAQLGKHGSSAGSSAPSPFDVSFAPPSLKSALEHMEEHAEVPATELMHTARYGDTDQIMQLASGAKGVTMSQAEIISQVPTYATSERSERSSQPTIPMSGGGMPFASAAHDTAPVNQERATSQPRLNASEAQPARAPSSTTASNFNELSSLGTDSLLKSFGAPQAQEESGGTLFHRVHQQYLRRVPGLAPSTSKGKETKAL